jgi:DNA-binding transcriptional MerR regulator
VTGTRELTLDELADAAGMTARNVRAYQSRGLLPPPRRDGRNALYGPEHVARLRLVRALHQRGLSLRVVRDMVDRGTAETELARLARDQLVATRAVLVPMSPGNVEAFEAAHPGTIDAMVEAGVVVREGGRVLASAAGLGLVSALLSRGVELEVSTRISLVAAEAARTSLDALRKELADQGDPGPDIAGLVVQLAASAYSDVLARRLDV